MNTFFPHVQFQLDATKSDHPMDGLTPSQTNSNSVFYEVQEDSKLGIMSSSPRICCADYNKVQKSPWLCWSHWWVHLGWLVLEMVPDFRFGLGCGSRPKHGQIGSPGCQFTRTVIWGMARQKSPNPTAVGRLSAGRPAGPSVDAY